MNLIITTSLLFFITFAGGAAALMLSKEQNLGFKHVLTFSGAYLFSITVTHLLPEIFLLKGDNHGDNYTAVFLLCGFFLQHILQQFSSGTEHGHFHHHAHEPHHSIVPIVVAMFLHSFLEGMLLMHPVHEQHAHGHEEVGFHGSSLLVGVIMHKVPEAFAFATVLYFRQKSRHKTLIYLILYSLCSPFGAFFGEIFTPLFFSDTQVNYVFALVAGNFLHISTTIFFENNPQHLFDLKKLSYIVAGAASAIVIDAILF
jgi:zinc transporter ZupT